MDNKIIYQNHINMISIQLLYCMGGYVTYEVTISTGRFVEVVIFAFQKILLRIMQK